MNNNWKFKSEAVRTFVEAMAEGTRYSKLAEITNQAFGTDFNGHTMKSYCKNRHISNHLPCGKLPGEEVSSIYPNDVTSFILENYNGVGPKDMIKLVSKKFGIDYTHGQMKGFYGRHHLNSGITGYYEKGHIPENKGKKQTEFMSPEAIEKTKATRFHKGNIPHNHREVGSSRITKDGYIEVKIAEPNVWELKHRIVWEKANGPIPKDMCIRFLDCDKLNCKIENLELITRAENAILTSKKMTCSDPEISKVGIMLARLDNSINERMREQI